MTAIPLGGHGSLRGQPLAENAKAFQCLFGVVGETLLLKGEILPKIYHMLCNGIFYAPQFGF